MLRRSDLLHLVEATPSERYEALKDFVDVGGVERSEQALRDLALRFRKQTNDEMIRQHEAAETLDEHWQQERQDGEDAEDSLAWAEARLSEDLADVQRRATALAEIDLSLLEIPKRLDELRASRVAAETASARLTEAKVNVAAAATTDALGPALLGVLRAGMAYLDTAARSGRGVDECPLCTQTVDGAALRSEARLRAEGIDSIRRLVDAVSPAERVVKSAHEELGRRAEAVRGLLAKIDGQLEAVVPSAFGDLGVRYGDLTAALAGATGAEVPATRSKSRRRSRVRPTPSATRPTRPGRGWRSRTTRPLCLSASRTTRRTSRRTWSSNGGSTKP